VSATAGIGVPDGDRSAPPVDVAATERWPATRFDGRSGAGTPVMVLLEGTNLCIEEGGRTERWPVAQTVIRESFEHAPTMVHLPDGATLEVRDPRRTLPAALRGAGRSESLVVRMQRRWPAVLLATVALVAGLSWTYAVGLPAFADRIAQWMPYRVEAGVGAPLLKSLDYYVFRPSALPRDRREAIARMFEEAARRSAPDVPVRLEFRGGDANALALPGGVIVLLDELTEVAQDDDQLLGILAHELGHVVHRHPMRQVTQAIGLFAIAGVLWGDVSAIAANATAILGAMHYSRGFEHEADAFALALLQREGRSALALDAVFARLAERVQSEGGALPEFLSTHPETDERRERLRARGAGATRARPAGALD